MESELNDHDFIRSQILRGMALNREPGYHFVGNFLDVSFDHVSTESARLSMDAASHCAETDGTMNLGAFAVLADLALAATVRSGLDAATRLATVHMSLQFTGVPLAGRLVAQSALQRFLQDAAAPQGLAQLEVNGSAGRVCHCTGAFMVLKPPAGVALYRMPQPRRGDAVPAQLPESELRRDERKVLQQADAALAAAAVNGDSFIRRFWGAEPHRVEGGASCSVRNGPHIGNRVGHVQGGVLFGLAADTARAALPANWILSNVSAWYISPGEGRTLRIRSRVVHHGRLTAVVRTLVTGKNNRRVLEVMTTHAHRA